MFERHDEHTAVINASVIRVFAHLDSQTRMSAHMSNRSWKIGEPRLLVIGQYSMGFDAADLETGVRLCVLIDYDLPPHGLPRILGRLFGRMYAKWCTTQMVQDAESTFAGGHLPVGTAGKQHE